MTAYRRHFIRLNMLLVGAVLLVTLALVGFAVIRNDYANMHQTMLETLEPFRGQNGLFAFTPDVSSGTAPKQFAEHTAENIPSAPPPPEGEAAKSSPLFSRCITVFFEKGDATIVSGAENRNEAEIVSAAQAAATMPETFGYLSAYDMFYLAAGQSESAKISLFPAQYFRTTIWQTALFLLAAFVLTLLACYFISRYISQIAVRPVEQAMEREKQFVADVSHDLKTPLAVMQACNHILQETPDRPIADVQPWLDRSRDAMQNMQALIDDMLALSAMDAAQRLPKQDPVNLSGIVIKAVLQMDAMAYDHGIELETDVQENVTVTGDADALLRVVSGLIENALKYEPHGGRIHISLTTHNRKAVLTVHNAGTFIAQEDLPHAFERFYRSDKARTTHQGHGLGLAIIHRTIELMHGKIDVASTPEMGTLFTVTLE